MKDTLTPALDASLNKDSNQTFSQDPNQVEKKVIVKNKAGLHSRPSSMIVKLASLVEGKIYIGTEGNMVNAKSIMGVMTLGAGQGTELLLQAEGSNAAEIVEKICTLFHNRFTE